MKIRPPEHDPDRVFGAHAAGEDGQAATNCATSARSGCTSRGSCVRSAKTRPVADEAERTLEGGRYKVDFLRQPLGYDWVESCPQQMLAARANSLQQPGLLWELPGALRRLGGGYTTVNDGC